MKLNCKNCQTNCCGIKNLVPILIPFEEKKFKKYAKKVKTPYRDVYLIKKNKNDRCIFFDEKNQNCSIYDERPIECRIYPYLFYFDGNEIRIELDSRICKQSNPYKQNKKEILGNMQKIKFPKCWIKANESKMIQKLKNAT
jgi:Fe-S-cluster containining protein